MPTIKIKSKHQPRGFRILYEDRDIIVGNKQPGALSVAAKWNREDTIESALTQYVRKGNSRSRQQIYVVHRLDQATSGLMVFAKTEEAQQYLKNHWQENEKFYYAVCEGVFEKKTGRIESFLTEDDDYHVHSHNDDKFGKKAISIFKVLKEFKSHSLVEVQILTGRKNQIRVHMAELGHPIRGDAKYGKAGKSSKILFLHSAILCFNHPFTQKRFEFKLAPPKYFSELVDYDYGADKIGLKTEA